VRWTIYKFLAGCKYQTIRFLFFMKKYGFSPLFSSNHLKKLT
jgi:hypothetical protein